MIAAFLAALLLQDAPDPRAAWAELGSLRASGDHAAALEVADEFLADGPADSPFHPYFALARADLTFQLGDGERALALLDELEATRAPDAEDDHMLWSLLGLRGWIHLLRDDVSRAAAPLERSLAIAEADRANGLQHAADIHQARGRAIFLALAQVDPERALELCERSLADGELLAGRDAWRGALLVDRGTALAQLELHDPERPKAAAESYVEALALLESDTDVAVRARAALAELRLDEGDVEGAGELLREAGVRDGRTATALATVAARHARMANARTDELRAHQGELEAALDRLVATWMARPVASGGTGFLHFRDRRALIGELLDLDVALDGPERAVARLFVLQAAGSLARKLGAGAPCLREVQTQVLGDGQGVLVYLFASRRSHAFAVDRGGVWHTRIAGYHELAEALRAYRNAIADHSADRERSAARNLADLLLPAPIEGRVDAWRGLYVTGLDSLGRVPFEWLPVGDAARVGLAKPVAYLASVPAGLDAARRRKEHAAGRSKLVVVHAPGHDGTESLRLEPETLAELYAPYSTVLVLEGEHATAANLQRAELHTARVLQLLVHGVEDTTRARPAGLALAGQEVLWSDAIESLGAPELVVMLACRTSAARARRGDPASADLGGAWLAAGAATVVLSDQAQHLDRIAELSSAFHRALRCEGISPAEALRRARRELDDAEAMPFTDGGIFVGGLGLRAMFHGDVACVGNSRRWLWVGALALALAGVLAALRVARR